MRTCKSMAVLTAASVLLLSNALPATAGGLSPPTEAAIRSANDRWAEAFGRGDYTAVSNLYTEDGALLPPNEQRVVGRAAIAAYLTKGFAGAAPDNVSFSNHEFYGDDDVVAEVSDTEIRDHAGNLKSRDKQTLIFVRRGEHWMLHRDMWSGNAPPNSDKH